MLFDRIFCIMWKNKSLLREKRGACEGRMFDM